MKQRIVVLLVILTILVFGTACDNSLRNGIVTKIVESTDKLIIEDKPIDVVNEDNELIGNMANTYKVLKVVDGDTIVIDFDGVEEKVRLIGVDTPESVHPDDSKNLKEGVIASRYTKAMLEDKEVSLEFDVEERDQYGRLLAYVYIDGVMYNKTLLKEGYAKIATFPPNVSYVNDFKLLQKEARENKKGLWADDDSNEISEASLIGSAKSDKYHYKGYTHDGQIAENNLVYFDSVEDATSKGYKPCGSCYPPSN